MVCKKMKLIERKQYLQYFFKKGTKNARYAKLQSILGLDLPNITSFYMYM